MFCLIFFPKSICASILHRVKSSNLFFPRKTWQKAFGFVCIGIPSDTLIWQTFTRFLLRFLFILVPLIKAVLDFCRMYTSTLLRIIKLISHVSKLRSTIEDSHFINNWHSGKVKFFSWIVTHHAHYRCVPLEHQYAIFPWTLFVGHSEEQLNLDSEWSRHHFWYYLKRP